jgi:hypothetical protein
MPVWVSMCALFREIVCMISFAGIIQIKFNRIISERLPLLASWATTSIARVSAAAAAAAAATAASYVSDADRGRRTPVSCSFLVLP